MRMTEYQFHIKWKFSMSHSEQYLRSENFAYFSVFFVQRQLIEMSQFNVPLLG